MGNPGYYTNEAVVVATESRTSSPVRIPRNETTLEHPQLKRLYPCGEGGGYAGGIVSAAIDGEESRFNCGGTDSRAILVLTRSKAVKKIRGHVTFLK